MKRLAALIAVGVVLVASPLALPAAEQITEIDGTWELTSFIEKGQEDAKIVQSKFVLVRENGIQSITKDGKPWGKKRAYRIDAKATPKQATWSDSARLDEAVNVGIYEIDGDTMKVAMFADLARQVTERPKDFTPSEDTIVVRYKRVKGK